MALVLVHDLFMGWKFDVMPYLAALTKSWRITLPAIAIAILGKVLQRLFYPELSMFYGARQSKAMKKKWEKNIVSIRHVFNVDIGMLGYFFALIIAEQVVGHFFFTGVPYPQMDDF